MKLCDLLEQMDDALNDLSSGYHLLNAQLRDQLAHVQNLNVDNSIERLVHVSVQGEEFNQLIKFNKELKGGVNGADVAADFYRGLTLAAEDEGFRVDRQPGDQVSIVVDQSNRKTEVAQGHTDSFSWVGLRRIK